jgi:DNA-binding MarR family transcriptional regulator
MTETRQPQDSLDSEALAGLFRRASRLMARMYHRQDHAHHAQHRVLSILTDQGPTPQGELLEMLDVRSSSLSEVLRKLELGGLVERTRSEQDKRSFVVAATRQAHALTSDTDGDSRSADLLFACLDDAERLQLRGILEKIVSSLKDSPLCQGPDHTDHRHGKGRRGFGPGGGKGRGSDGRGREGFKGRGRREDG